jgi:hypothetical protein
MDIYTNRIQVMEVWGEVPLGIWVVENGFRPEEP